MKKLVSVLLAVFMLLSITAGLNFSAQAATPTQSQAVSWAKSQINKGLDYDGKYGAQCVDLIYYYYQYLGAPISWENAEGFRWNTLPSGWQRIKYSSGFVAQPGDIAVWKTNHNCETCYTDGYGHIGIITSADKNGFNAVNQNFNGNSFCTENWFYASALDCVIRPNFGGKTVDPLSFNIEGASSITTNSAVIKFKTNNPYIQVVSKVGLRIKKTSEANWSKTYEEPISSPVSTYNPLVTEYVIGAGKEINYTLEPGTSYTYQPFAVTGGKTYYGDTKTFTTKPEETKATTEATSKATTEATSKATTEATSKATTEATSKATTEATSKAITEATRANDTTKQDEGKSETETKKPIETTKESTTKDIKKPTTTKEHTTKNKPSNDPVVDDPVTNTPPTQGNETPSDFEEPSNYEDDPSYPSEAPSDVPSGEPDPNEAPHQLSWSEVALLIIVAAGVIGGGIAIFIVRKKSNKNS